MKKTVIVFVVILIVLITGSFYLLYNQKNKILETGENVILFEKRESWGPCPPNSTCFQSTKLYYSGKLILQGNRNLTKYLDEETVSAIINKIKGYGIIDKDCSGSFALPDYSAVYNLNTDGKNKTIKYPNCQQELEDIEKLILIK